MNGWIGAVITVVPLSLMAWWSVPEDMEGGVSGVSVYQSEGCIHCHSQFSRPLAIDELRYGPATEPPGDPGGPVLIGNRRQGPDLSNVGLRRSREWNRLHLIDPQAVSPGSRMPGYEHLFEGDGVRGEALLDYLGGLGIESAPAWSRTMDSWAIDLTIPSDPENGAALFSSACSICHGPDGRGDGPSAGSLARTPADLSSGSGIFVPGSLSVESAGLRRARIIKFGVPGTSMPGHEYLTDQEIADLVNYLALLRAADRIGTQG